ncbi:hypothetical protein GQ53DRAFT_832832 [Thozetella sp. PMI_491]|nr:hypothetical protein GQ53DRAFT_832832 [Thozetella sp. PMI_491]
MKAPFAIVVFACAVANANPVAPRQTQNANVATRVLSLPAPVGTSIIYLPSGTVTPALKQRQDIDFDAYEVAAALATTAAPPNGDAAPQASIDYDPTSLMSAVVAQVTSVDPEAAETNTFNNVIAKRAATACTTRTYNGPRVTTPTDTPEAFLAYQPFADAAINASKPANVPVGYKGVDGFVNLQATAQNNAYLTYISSALKSYDVGACAAVCDGMAGCNSFVIYYERNPLVVSNATQVPDATLCPANKTSPSTTLIKCAFYGQPVKASQATNNYQFWSSFKYVYAGANAYAKYAITVDGFKPPISYNNATVSAPAPAVNHGFLRTETFGANVPFDPSQCAASCNAQTLSNAEKGTLNGSACVFFDAYILYKNGVNGVFTCSYYSQGYEISYATNYGQSDSSNNRYTIGNSYAYYLDMDLSSVCSSLFVSTTTSTTL